MRKCLLIWIVMAMTVGLVARTARATTMFWDGGTTDIGTNGNGISNGGPGTWNSSLLNWDVGSSSHVAWANANNDTAVFGGTAGVITLGNPITVGGLAFTAADILTNNTLTFGSSGSISNSATVTIFSVLAGPNAITKAGSGTLTLSGTNTYSGGTFLNGGTFYIGNPVCFGTGPVTFTGATTLNPMYNASGTVLTNAYAVNSGVVATFNHPSAYFFFKMSGPLSGNGTLALSGASAQSTCDTWANTNNTFTGILYNPSGIYQAGGFVMNSLADSTNSIRLGAGKFELGTGALIPLVLNQRHVELLGTTTGATINNASTSAAVTLTINTDLLISGVGNKTFTFGGANAGNNTFAGKIADASGSVISLAKADAGTWVLSGTNNYGGITTIASGTLEIGGTGVLGNGTYLANVTNNATLRYASTAAQTLRGVISGTGALIVTNGGTLTLAGGNSYSGSTTIRSGTLLGVTGGSCSNSAMTVTNTPGNTSAIGVLVTNNAMQWTCANLTFKTNGVGSELQFSFAGAPSTTLAPLVVTNNLVFSGAPVIVVDAPQLLPGTYPLLVVGGTAPSVVPAVRMQGLYGVLAWGGTGNKTLYLTVPPSGANFVLY